MAAKKDAKTATAEKLKPEAPKEAPPASAQAVATTEQQAKPTAGLRLRIAYPVQWGQRNSVDPDTWRMLQDAAWPNAKTAAAITLAWAYCKWRSLDPLKKMIHIVPIWDKSLETTDENGRTKKGGWSEGVWPGIAEIRVTATRTGVYAGKDAMEFGPIKERTFQGVKKVWKNRQQVEEPYQITLSYPEWARLTVYKIVQGHRCAFVGPQVKWEEAYATESRESEAPNEMWSDRSQGQLDKCAEAAALRAAFPEELGGEHAAEEMWGRAVEHAPSREVPGHVPLLTGEVRPAAAGGSEFSRAAPVEKAQTAETATPAKNDVPKTSGEDPRGETPPLEGEAPRQQQAALALEEEGPHDDTEAPAAARLKVVEMLDAAVARLNVCTKVGQIADLREEIEQEIPPAFEDLVKQWNDACDAQQQLIVDAKKKPK